MENIILYGIITCEILSMINYIIKKELQLKEIEDNLKLLRKEDIDIKSRVNKLEKGKE